MGMAEKPLLWHAPVWVQKVRLGESINTVNALRKKALFQTFWSTPEEITFRNKSVFGSKIKEDIYTIGFCNIQKMNMEYYFFLVWFFLIGSVIGSFLNVCIYRIPEGKSIVYPVFSFCPACKNKIIWKDNIPLISYLLLKGKCRHCNSKISLRYPIVEFIAGVLTLINFVHFGLSFQLIFYSVFFYFLIVLSFIDIDKGILPREITVSGFICGTLLGYFGTGMSIFDIIIGGVTGGLVILVAGYIGKIIFRKESMGGGDVFLSMMIGFFLGYKNVLISIWLAFLIAFIFILGYVIKTKTVSGRIKFGPFLSLGAYVCVFFGEELFNWYLRVI